HLHQNVGVGKQRRQQLQPRCRRQPLEKGRRKAKVSLLRRPPRQQLRRRPPQKLPSPRRQQPNLQQNRRPKKRSRRSRQSQRPRNLRQSQRRPQRRNTELHLFAQVQPKLRMTVRPSDFDRYHRFVRALLEKGFQHFRKDRFDAVCSLGKAGSRLQIAVHVHPFIDQSERSVKLSAGILVLNTQLREVRGALFHNYLSS